MSEHENASGVIEHASPALLAETASKKNSSTMLHRPTDLRDEGVPDLYQKHAPAVSSMTENWRVSVENSETKDIDNAVSTERQKYVAKKLSSNISSKRRSSSPAVIPLAPIGPESKAYEMVPLSMPVQPMLAPTVPEPVPEPQEERKKDAVDRKSDEDSITSEIVEMRTPEVAKKSPEWEADALKPLVDDTVEEIQNAVADIKVVNNSELTATTSAEVLKQSTWNSTTYLEKVELQNMQVSDTILKQQTRHDRRSAPLKRPSGINISLPKKSLNNINYISDDCYTKSGINITVSKRCIDRKSKSFIKFDTLRTENTNEMNLENEVHVKAKEENSNYYAHLKGKFDNFCGKIKHALHISI